VQAIVTMKGDVTMKADAATEAGVMAAMNDFTEAYAKQDLALLRSRIAPDADVVMFGTGADEKRIGLAQIEEQAKRDWSQADETGLSYEWMSISSAGPVAWVAADATFHMKAGGQEMALPGRGTAVLEKRGDKWLIVQSHFSFAAPNQGEGESFPS
jgi:ketosteroid isomerase-like protein